MFGLEAVSCDVVLLSLESGLDGNDFSCAGTAAAALVEQSAAGSAFDWVWLETVLLAGNSDAEFCTSGCVLTLV